MINSTGTVYSVTVASHSDSYLGWTITALILAAILAWVVIERRGFDKEAHKLVAEDGWIYEPSERNYPLALSHNPEKPSRVSNFLQGSVEGFEIISFEFYTPKFRGTISWSQVAVRIPRRLPYTVVTPDDYTDVSRPTFSADCEDRLQHLPNYGREPSNKGLRISSVDLHFAARITDFDSVLETKGRKRFGRRSFHTVGWILSGPYIIGVAHERLLPVQQVHFARFLIRTVQSFPSSVWDEYGRDMSEDTEP